ncbi:hypothetical protein IP88_09870 [alpha proteobacterium AAP81b]|nr:hypothetical protein IP88_09870 [alpha proteobacterium AAP81b]
MRSVIPLMLMALTAGAATAAETAPVSGTLLTVVAEGRVARAPDLVEISGGVVSDAPTAAAAMAANAKAMTAVVAAVRKAGIAGADVQTQGLSLQPQYRYEQNRPPELIGYQASNSVAVKVRRIADTGRLLDTLVAVGANRIDGPNFRIEDADGALDTARAEAVARARARAQLYARAAGLTIRRIVAISESGAMTPPRPMMMARMAAAEAVSTPVAPGEVALSVNVTVEFELQ